MLDLDCAFSGGLHFDWIRRVRTDAEDFGDKRFSAHAGSQDWLIFVE